MKVRNIFAFPATNIVIIAFKPFYLQASVEQETFVKLVRENSGIIHKVCRVYCFSEADRQDLFQEIIVQLWRSWPRFRGESKFSTWLYRIALNTAISDLRKKHRRQPTTPIDPIQINTDLQDIQYAKEEEEQLQQLYAAIEKLSEIEKALVMLYLEDRSYEEMEEILGLSQNNLRVKMNRIKDKLRKMTKEAEYGIGKS